MRKLERLLVSCSRNIPPGQAVRNLIGFKKSSSYRRCLKELARHGIATMKNINGSRMICCTVNKSEKRLLRSLARHPHVRFVEPDYKIRAHGIPTAGSAGGRRIGKRQSRESEEWRAGGAPRPARGSRVLRARGAALRISAAGRATSRRGGHRPRPASSCPAGVTWNVCRVQAPDVWRKTRGGGIGIGIIDTGIAKHPDLRIAGGVNTIGGRSYQDDNGHGTHVAGIAAALGTRGQIPGVAPRAKLYAVKALDSYGEGFISDIIEGIEWCIRRKIPVINMSFGLEGGKSAALRAAIRRAHEKGIVVTASAGNSGVKSGGIDEPASFPETIAVAASTRTNKIADYSSRGTGIDITAPGSDIKSTWLNGGYNILSGTSMAAPHAAGAAALLLARNPRLTPSRVSARLKASARRLNGYSALSQGSGLLQLARALASGRHRQSRCARRAAARSGAIYGRAAAPYLAVPNAPHKRK